jgi:hypothetical protein
LIRVARPGTKIVIVDEQERAARLYDQTLPGFRRSFRGTRPSVTAPVQLVPASMEALRLTNVWGGWFYCLEFRKPAEVRSGVVSPGINGSMSPGPPDTPEQTA